MNCILLSTKVVVGLFMIVAIFLLLILSLSFGYFGKKYTSITCFYICFFMSIIWFIHHATDKLNLSF